MPRPILENTLGLLLCYDEIWFISRSLCPAAMRNLPYVKFVEDFPDLTNRVIVACDQYGDIARNFSKKLTDAHRKQESEGWNRIWTDIQEAFPFEMSLDNHSRGVVLSGTLVGSPFPGAPENAVLDWGVAASLDFDVDITINTPLARSLSGELTETRRAGGLTGVHVRAAELLLPVQAADWHGPDGAYHESIEDLREHPNIREFRHYLGSVDAVDKSGEDLARHVSDLALSHSRDVLERFVKGRGKIKTLGSAAIGMAGNAVQPGLGSVIGGAISGLDFLKERKLRKEVAWSVFVLDAQRFNRSR